MRDRSSWKQHLVLHLEKDPALVEHVRQFGYTDPTEEQRHVSRLARLIADVELGLTLLGEVDPNAAADDVRWLLSGYRYPIAPLAEDEIWARVQRARMYLVRRKGRYWRPALEEYLSVPIQLRCYDCPDAKSVPRCLSSGGRVEVYHKALEHSPLHQPFQPSWAPAGRLYARVRRDDDTPVVAPMDLPQDLLDRLPLGPYAVTRQDRGDQNPPIEVVWNDLREAAREMDRQSEEPYYEDALDRFVIKVRDIEGGTYRESAVIRLNGLLHIVGLVNVGKTTILKILAFWLARNQKRVAFVVGDVVTAVRFAAEFAFRYELKAAPILGARDRKSHLEKVYKALLADSGEEIRKGADHPAQRWFSTLCPLLALVKSEERWASGDEPCENLYKTPEGAERRGGADEDGKNRNQAYTCPLYAVCPRHQLERDMAEADVWFLTRSSLVQTRTPPAGFPHELFFGEAVYRDCHVLLVDEADKIQVALDEAFAPDEILVDQSQDAFLNRIGEEVVQRYHSARSAMRGSRYSAWQTAESAAQAATNLIYRLLLTRPHLRDWLGISPFTGRSLFSRIARDLAHAPQEQPDGGKPSNRAERQAERIRRITQQQSTEARGRIEQLMTVFREYLESPLYIEDHHDPMAASLANIVATLLLSEDEKRARSDLRRWTEQWAAAHRPYIRDWPDSPEEWDDLLDRLHFALLMSVLDDRLGYLVDHMSEVKPVLDLDDAGANLVHRPPLDYLAVLPEAPVGNILGFQYIPGERTEKYSGLPQGGKLVYFRYVGVGRDLLRSFPTLFAVDGRQGPHTILTSGTSVAPGSPAYHINVPPVAMLAPRQTAEVLSETHCALLPQVRHDRDGAWPMWVSGLQGDRRRGALAEMTKMLCQRDMSGQVPLTRILQTLKDLGRQHPYWFDRERILVVTGSYPEAELVADILQRYAFSLDLSGDAVAVLRSDGAAPDQDGIRRGEVADLRHTGVRILVVPLLALERGHNILNDRKQAAFGAVLLMVRPMPIPDNWQSVVQELNAWALQTIATAGHLAGAKDDDERSPLRQIASRFYRHALAQMYNLSARPYGYRHLTSAERHALCWTQFISLWQLSARLIRGNVPARIYFVDSVFAPISTGLVADPERAVDTPETSLLVGIIEALRRPYLDREPQVWEQELLDSLYGVIAKSLHGTEGLEHGVPERESRRVGVDR